MTPELTHELGDLSHGFKTFIQKDVRSHLHPILAVLNQQPEAPRAHIITWRGILTRILATPFDTRAEWAMYGTVRSGVLYMEEERLPQDTSARGQQCTYWGHKFETLCMVGWRAETAELPSLAVRREEPVNTNEEFGIVVTTRLGEHRFVLGAEVDGLDEAGRQYIELKTSKLRTSHHDERFFKEKLLKYWLQSYLVNVPEVVVGFRNNSGWIKELQTFKTADIPRYVRGHVRWDPNAVLLMGDQFFTWLRARVAADVALHGDGISFQLRHDKNGGGRIEYRMSSDRHAELPDWYKYYKDA